MKRHVTLAALTAVAIAASSIVATGSAFAAPAAAPQYKPLRCLFFPTLDVCSPKKPVAHHVVHHAAKKMPKK